MQYIYALFINIVIFQYSGGSGVKFGDIPISKFDLR